MSKRIRVPSIDNYSDPELERLRDIVIQIINEQQKFLWNFAETFGQAIIDGTTTDLRVKASNFKTSVAIAKKEYNDYVSNSHRKYRIDLKKLHFNYTILKRKVDEAEKEHNNDICIESNVSDEKINDRLIILKKMIEEEKKLYEEFNYVGNIERYYRAKPKY